MLRWWGNDEELTFWRWVNARNVSFRNSLRRPIYIIAELAERSPIIIQNTSNPSSRKNLDVRPSDRMTAQETTDLIVCDIGRLLAFLILLGTLRPFYLSKEGQSNKSVLDLHISPTKAVYGLTALTRPNWDEHSSFFKKTGCRLVTRYFCWNATSSLACSPASTVRVSVFRSYRRHMYLTLLCDENPW